MKYGNEMGQQAGVTKRERERVVPVYHIDQIERELEREQQRGSERVRERRRVRKRKNAIR